MRFEFAAPARVLFGAGVLAEIGPLARDLGRRACVVTGRATTRAQRLLELLDSSGIEAVLFSVEGEPTTDLVDQGTRTAKEGKCDLVIGFGGGSALDAAKAIAALVTNEGHLLDYLEVIGQGKTLTAPPLPFIAVPTTSGTGTEVTRNAVLASPEHRVKVSLRSPGLLARLAVIDPELTNDLPPALTASTGLDALTQLIEPFVSVRANPLTDAFCREGLVRASRSLRRAYHEGHDARAREDMSVASLLGGLALANAGLGAVHGFAAPIGGMFPAPHGAVCAGLLPWVMEANVRALRDREPDSEALERYDEVARLLTGSPQTGAEEGLEWVRSICQEMRIPPLSCHGPTEADLPVLCDRAAVASSMKGNPITLTQEEMRTILRNAL